MKETTIKFLSPANQMISIKYHEVNDFCKSLCVLPENKERFIEFQKDYSMFNAYFDFVMFELKYIMINVLGGNKIVTSHGDGLYNLVYPDIEYDYFTIRNLDKSYYYETPYMTKCSDRELNPVILAPDYPSSIITPNGICLMSRSGIPEARGSHAVTARTILNQYLSSNKEILDQYVSNNKPNALSFLINQLGYLRVLSKEELGLVIYNSEVVDDRLYQIINSYDVEFHDESKRTKGGHHGK